MNERCNGCGRRDVATAAFTCRWPDGRVTVERHCYECRLTWHRQLRSLGAVIEEIPVQEPGSRDSREKHTD